MQGIPVLVSMNATVSIDERQSDSMNLLTSGQLICREDGDFLLTFQESLEESGEEYPVEVLIQKDSIIMTRGGEFATQMVFRRGNRFEGQYETPYGCMELAIFCTRLSIRLSGGEGTILLRYQLDMNGQFVSMHDMEIRFSPKEGKN